MGMGHIMVTRRTSVAPMASALAARAFLRSFRRACARLWVGDVWRFRFAAFAAARERCSIFVTP